MDLKRALRVVITAAVLLIATLSACNNDNDRQVANLEFAGGDITLAVGKNAELPLMIVYNDGSKEPCSFNDRSKGISVSSRNESVVVVTSEGILVPVSKGYTAIDAVVEGISASVNVFVNDSGDIPFPNTKMTLKPNSIYLFANNNRNLGALAVSLSDYWLNTYILASQDLENEPSEQNIERIKAFQSFADNEEDADYSILTADDWETLRDFVDDVAEDLDLDSLQSMMNLILQNGALE